MEVVRFSDRDEAFKTLEHVVKNAPASNDDADKKAAKTEAACDLARHALKLYNTWLSGEVYGWCVATFDLSGSRPELEQDQSVWGFVGQDHCERDAKGEFMESVGRLLQEGDVITDSEGECTFIEYNGDWSDGVVVERKPLL